MVRTLSRAGLALAAVAVIAAASCGRQLQRLTGANEPPQVRVLSSELLPSTSGEFRHVVRWRGWDPDGSVDHYLVAVNPTSLTGPATGWTVTSATEYVVTAREGDPLVLAIRAVDSRGAESVSAYRAFLDDSTGPSVQITAPVPSPFIVAALKAGQVIRWQGEDPDAPNGLPAGYRYKFIMESTAEIPLHIIRNNPDTLRNFYAPDYEGWESGDAATLSAAVPDGDPENGMFAVVAVDAAGATTPYFSLSTNVLTFRRAHPMQFLGPIIELSNEWFNYTAFGAALVSPPLEVAIDVSPDRATTMNWSASSIAGLTIDGFRWALDIADVFDETARQNKNDLAHWSEWDLSTRSATVGPFHGPDASREHRLYIEARDNLGNISLVAVVLRPGATPRDRELLIVDDTRLRPDRLLSTGQLDRPRGPWPTAAELDSFLYARGGFPWQGYPEGTTSTPGLFSAYDFDTIGTRTGQNDLTVPLETLLRYRNVVWITDAIGATFDGNGNDPVEPQTALRYMVSPGRSNTLAAFVERGGRLWILGGGAAHASSAPWNVLSNDQPTFRFSSVEGRELVPGRFMWDIAAWRSEFRAVTAQVGGIARVAPTSTHPLAPRYGRMPATFDLKSPLTDPLPPTRTTGDFYRLVTPAEFLTLPNVVVEDLNPGDPEQRDESVLDTLYQASNPVTGPNAPLVTYYRGPDHAPVLFSGLDVWSYRRSQCLQMVDAVLQDLWRLAPVGGEPIRRGGTLSSRTARPVAPGMATPGGTRPGGARKAAGTQR